MDIKDYATEELIDELETREYVKRTNIASYEILEKTVLGPAVVLTYRPDENVNA